MAAADSVAVIVEGVARTGVMGVVIGLALIDLMKKVAVSLWNC